MNRMINSGISFLVGYRGSLIPTSHTTSFNSNKHRKDKKSDTVHHLRGWQTFRQWYLHDLLHQRKEMGEITGQHRVNLDHARTAKSRAPVVQEKEAKIHHNWGEEILDLYKAVLLNTILPYLWTKPSTILVKVVDCFPILQMEQKPTTIRTDSKIKEAILLSVMIPLVRLQEQGLPNGLQVHTTSTIAVQWLVKCGHSTV